MFRNSFGFQFAYILHDLIDQHIANRGHFIADNKGMRVVGINNIDNARVVYRLSDELLNNMYQTFKNDWNKEDFDKLTESQLKWIEKKTKIEEEYKNDDLVRYQTLIEMTLDKCEEWTEYYR